MVAESEVLTLDIVEFIVFSLIAGFFFLAVTQ
jgi:hypothetical protein